MSNYTYESLFQFSEDRTVYRKIDSHLVTTSNYANREVLEIDPAALTLIAKEAMADVSFYLRPAHLKKIQEELLDSEASENDRFVLETMLKNACIAAQGELPTCQDTGTALVMGKKGENVYTGCNDADQLSRGIYETYQERNLRYSQIAPLTMLKEKNTGTNLPAQIDTYATGGMEYHFLFVAKGGGSANKTYLYQETKELLQEKRLAAFFEEKIKTLGTAACPPYHLAFVIGGTSAEMNLKTVKLASVGYLDTLPTTGSEGGRAFRDTHWEERILKMCQDTGIGAQFGGKHFAHDVRVIRLPRHAASCPVGMGVSCSADRNIKAKITKDGLFIEQMEKNPEAYLPATKVKMKPAVEINLDRPMAAILAELSQYPIKTRLSLHGTLVVARDMAHARIKEMIDADEPMPEYFKNYPIYYAGPAKTPAGKASGSFGPTTANRMDPYVEPFQVVGGSMIMLAKGNRSACVRDACKKNGGFYLGSIGGPAAILAEENITHVEVIDFEEFGMEAVRKITVKNFPAFIICDDKGNDFFA